MIRCNHAVLSIGLLSRGSAVGTVNTLERTFCLIVSCLDITVKGEV